MRSYLGFGFRRKRRGVMGVSSFFLLCLDLVRRDGNGQKTSGFEGDDDIFKVNQEHI